MVEKMALRLSADLLDMPEDESLISPSTIEDPAESFRASEFESNKIYYISDLHLDNTLAKQYGLNPNKKQIKSFIDHAVNDLSQSFSDLDSDHVLIFNGDTANEFLLNKLFFTAVRQKFPRHTIVVILGNHELWGRGCSGTTVEDIVTEYRSFFATLNIQLLHNDLLAFGWGKTFFLSEESILNATDEELEDAAQACPYFILGGTGFTGYEPTHNASRGYYRETIKTVEEDRQQSDKFRKVYDKVLKTFSQKRLFVVTHSPKNQWSPEGNLDRCIYISGHTHRNTIRLLGNRAEFADNQVGYYSNRFIFKTISPTYPIDIFSEWEDGKYLIPGGLYSKFYSSLGLSASIDNRIKVLMLKRSGYYCFLLRKPNGAYWLLAGGRKRNISRTPNEIYDNMVDYASKMNDVFSEYNSKLAKISKFVKSFGGNGRIHGCIVDIDFYNHLYLCPFTGKLTPYFATDMVHKHVYPTIEKLLSKEAPALLSQYQEKLKELGKEDFSKTLTKNQPADKVQYYSSTDIYKISRVFLTFQYLSTAHIIRMWIDTKSKGDTPILATSMGFDEILPDESSKEKSIDIYSDPTNVVDLTEELARAPSDYEEYVKKAFIPLCIDSKRRSNLWGALADNFYIGKRLTQYDILRYLYFSKNKHLKKRDFEEYLEYAEKEVK